MKLIFLMAAIWTFVAFSAPVRATITPPGTQVLLGWASLGSGTTYYVQSSTNLPTWTTLISTEATSASLSLNGVASCMFRLLASNAPPQSATWAWGASTPAASVAGYYVYYGGATGNYTNRIDAGLATNYVMNNLLAGSTYYVAATAYSSDGEESGYSNEVVWQCPLLLNIQPSP
jgi:hypothetical protein